MNGTMILLILSQGTNKIELRSSRLSIIEIQVSHSSIKLTFLNS